MGFKGATVRINTPEEIITCSLGKIRTFILNNERYFVAKDIAGLIGYSHIHSLYVQLSKYPNKSYFIPAHFSSMECRNGMYIMSAEAVSLLLHTTRKPKGYIIKELFNRQALKLNYVDKREVICAFGEFTFINGYPLVTDILKVLKIRSIPRKYLFRLDTKKFGLLDLIFNLKGLSKLSSISNAHEIEQWLGKEHVRICKDLALYTLSSASPRLNDMSTLSVDNTASDMLQSQEYDNDICYYTDCKSEQHISISSIEKEVLSINANVQALSNRIQRLLTTIKMYKLIQN